MIEYSRFTYKDKICNIFRIKEEALDLHNSVKIQKAIMEDYMDLSNLGKEYIIIDLEEVGYIDSSGIGCIHKLKQFYTSKLFGIINLNNDTNNILNMVSSSLWIPIYKDKEDFLIKKLTTNATGDI